MLHHPARGPELGPLNRRAGKLPFDEPQQVLHRYTAIQQLNHLFDAESRMLAYDGKLENAPATDGVAIPMTCVRLSLGYSPEALCDRRYRTTP